ncbi:MAG: hypothetical protein ACQEXQ_21035 [Bacillota bacterium]
MKWIIISILVLCIIVLSGCTENTNYYGGIKKTDFPEMSDSNFELVHEYRGHSDNWGAVFFVYKQKDSDKLTIKKFLVYNGKDPKPTGEISFDYDAGDIVGSGNMTTTEVPEKGIYYLGSSLEAAAPAKDSIVKLFVKWKEYSEWVELKPVTD